MELAGESVSHSTWAPYTQLRGSWSWESRERIGCWDECVSEGWVGLEHVNGSNGDSLENTQSSWRA